MKRSFKLFLQDIVDGIRRIKEYTDSLELDDFLEKRMTIDAVVRNIEIIGEATKHVPERIKEKYSSIPWTRVQNMRNIVVHKYWGVDTDVLWDIIKNKLDELEEQIQDILSKEQPHV